MRGIVIGLVLLTGCASFNINAFGVPVDGRNVYAASQNPAHQNPALDEPSDHTFAGPGAWVVFVIVAVAAGFGVYAGTSS